MNPCVTKWNLYSNINQSTNTNNNDNKNDDNKHTLSFIRISKVSIRFNMHVFVYIYNISQLQNILILILFQPKYYVSSVFSHTYVLGSNWSLMLPNKIHTHTLGHFKSFLHNCFLHLMWPSAHSQTAQPRRNHFARFYERQKNIKFTLIFLWIT